MECGCGRSPTGQCIGWHKLSEEEYQEKLKEYQDKEKDENWTQLDLSWIKKERLEIKLINEITTLNNSELSSKLKQRIKKIFYENF